MIDEFKESNDELINELLKEYVGYEENIYRIRDLLEELKGCSDKSQIETIIEELQGINNKLFELKNSEMLIDLQVIINRYRNEYDITDPREIIHTDNGKGFVQ